MEALTPSLIASSAPLAASTFLTVEESCELGAFLGLVLGQVEMSTEPERSIIKHLEINIYTVKTMTFYKRP